MDNRINLLKSLADETRFNIIKSLLKKEKTVSALVAEVKKAQPTVSLHLKLLQLNNIISSRKEGTELATGWPTCRTMKTLASWGIRQYILWCW